MKSRLLPPMVTLAVLAAWATNLSTARADAKGRPNVLFLFTDDQRADTIAALGNSHIKTPTLDSLAQRGFIFNNAYCVGANAGAVCRPSRNMLLSGRAYFRFGAYASGDDPNFPTSMKQAGYTTYHHGKRGNTALQIHKKFDYSKYVSDGQARTSGEPGKIIVDNAIEFLKTKPDERPFFMYLAFASPHDPRVAAQKYLDEYPSDSVPLPKNYLPVHPFNNGEMTIRDERLAPWPRTKAEIRKQLREYYAVITGLDHHIGRLLQSLKDRGEYDNTIIVFSSDHGLALGSHGLMGKQSVYDHSMKSPLIFAGPGIPHGSSDALVYLLDIYPTVCDLVGAATPEGLDGKSLKPIILGQTDQVRDSLFNSYQAVQRAVRDDRWKLIRYPQINKSQLFDLKNDPHELHNLADDPEQAARVKRMMALMESWQTRLGDKLALTSEKPADASFTPPKPGDGAGKRKKNKKNQKAKAAAK